MTTNDVVERIVYDDTGHARGRDGTYDVIEQVVGGVAFLRRTGMADLRDLRLAPAHVWAEARREAGLALQGVSADVAAEEAADGEAGITDAERRHWGMDD